MRARGAPKAALERRAAREPLALPRGNSLRATSRAHARPNVRSAGRPGGRQGPVFARRECKAPIEEIKLAAVVRGGTTFGANLSPVRARARARAKFIRLDSSLTQLLLLLLLSISQRCARADKTPRAPTTSMKIELAARRRRALRPWLSSRALSRTRQAVRANSDLRKLNLHCVADDCQISGARNDSQRR